MDHDELTRVADDRVHPLEAGLDEFLPEFAAHLQALLLAPVVAEVNGVDIIFQGFADLGDIIVSDRVKELVKKFGIVIEIHKESFHAAHRPGSFVEREANRKHSEAIRISFEL